MALEPILKVGLLTDVHYADAETRGTRHYRESLDKMREAVARLNAEKVDIAIELGDLVDTPQPPDTAKETGFLRTIAGEFGKLRAPRHFVLGNHCVSGLTKAQFLKTVGQKRSWYSFDQSGVHCVILDACFRRDGVPYAPGGFAWTDSDIPPDQRAWLAADLKATPYPTLVFVHQRLDEAPGEGYRIASRAAVRAILEKSGKVLAVFQGHSHKNELQTIGGIPYGTLAAIVEGAGPENSGCSVLNVYADRTITLTGFRRHAEHPLAKKSYGTSRSD
ncbi:MAG: metallophosphoesterase [Armatimonadota bacterium]